MNWQQAIRHLRGCLLEGGRAVRTADNYCGWCRKFQQYVKSKPVAEVKLTDADEYFTKKALVLSVSSQRQCQIALKLLFSVVLQQPWHHAERVRRKHIRKADLEPIVILTPAEVRRLLDVLDPPFKLIGQLIYGCGLALTECLTLRVTSIDLVGRRLKLLEGKSRDLPLPLSVLPAIREQLAVVEKVYQDDYDKGFAGCFMTAAFRATHAEADPLSLQWQYLFPAFLLTPDADQYQYHRSFLHQTHVQRAMQKAVRRSKLGKIASARTLRHSCCVHLLAQGYPIKAVQQMMNHADIRTTKIYLPLVEEKTAAIQSPLDFLP